MSNEQRNHEQQEPSRTWTEKRAGLLRREDINHIDYPQWVVEGVLPAEAVSMVYGRSGTGKSFWALDVALCIATGRKWHGHAVKQGEVVYVAGEGKSGYKARLEAWEKKHQACADAFCLWPAPVRLWRNPDSVQNFIDGVNGASVHPALVVLDTLANCLGGASENDNGQMRELLDSAEAISREWNAAVLLIHHTGSVGQRARGAQALQDGVAMHAYLFGDGKTYGMLTCTKQKDAEPFDLIRRTLHEVDLSKGMRSLCFADDHKTGPRDRTRRRVTWPEISDLLHSTSIPMTPKMVAEALQMERRAAHNHLTRAEARKDVYQPDDTGAYALVENVDALCVA